SQRCAAMWPGCARDIALFCGRKWAAPWRKRPRLTRSCDIFAKFWHRISEHSSRDAQFHSFLVVAVWRIARITGAIFAASETFAEEAVREQAKYGSGKPLRLGLFA